MIRKLTENDRAALMELLLTEPALNLFIIGDVENFGFEQDFMELWGDIDPASGIIQAGLLRFYDSYLPFAGGPFEEKALAEIITQDPKFSMLSGPADIVHKISRSISFRKEKQLHFAELKNISKPLLEAVSSGAPIRKATVDEVEAVCRLTDQITEFESNRESSRKSLKKTLESGTGRTYYLEHEGQVIATASTTAENSRSAMVIGVATHPDYRQQGLATRLAAQLCADVLNEGKSLCLFYDNPKAGVIYKRLGFQDIGNWAMMYT
ncbi:N-acetyltransferase [Paenibacillus albidus]|uniref:N-acetyltransferase n=1 Tax=Paenibacillus albidus TaxID=2041023 RepID=A0A917C0H7_9BACL|nr:GNAT family N-acetyltransferase [Paenibacillus albidus]GGF64136.1 N-acetyltransferase [Paenibacillus albidus]